MPLFGAVHLLLLAAVIAAAVTLSILCRRRLISGRAVRLVLGYGIAINECIWWIFRYSHEGLHLANLPLQLCDLTVWVTVLACLTRNGVAVEFAYFTGLVGPGMALLTPDLWSSWPSYPAIYFFLVHGGIVVASAVLVFGKIAEVRRGAIKRVFALILVYAAALGLFNAIAGTNYMYLCRKPANPSALDWFGPWPVYLLGGAALALVLFWVLWLPMRRTNKALRGPKEA